MSGVARRVGAALVAAFVFLAALVLVGAPSTAHASEPGCVLSGGGWICYGTQQPSEPGELPVLEAPADPVPVVDEPAVEVPATVEPAPVVEPAPAPVPVAEPAPAPAPASPVAQGPVEAAAPVASDVPGPVVVDGAPPAPTFTDPCGVDNVEIALPADAGPWLYEVHRDEVGGTGFVQAYLPEGFVIGAGEQAGDRYWDPVFEFVDSQTLCVTEQAAPAPGASSTPEPAPPVVPDTLAATGPADSLWAVGGIAAVIIAAGTILTLRRRTT